jgi:hypothetical protein
MDHFRVCKLFAEFLRRPADHDIYGYLWRGRLDRLDLVRLEWKRRDDFERIRCRPRLPQEHRSLTWGRRGVTHFLGMEQRISHGFQSL